MYYIVVYDIAEKRENKVIKLMRKYMNWEQNSVFEGELSDGQFEEMLVKLRNIINLIEDSVLIYSMEKKWGDREVIGVERSEVSRII